MDTAFSKQALLVPGGSGQRSGLEGAPTISEAKGEIVRVLKQMDALRPAPGEQRTSGSRERWGDLQQPAPPSFLQQPLPPRKLPPPPPPSFKPLHCSSSSSSSSASEKRKTESTGEGDPAGKRARADDGGVEDRGDLPVRSSSSREPMAVQGLRGSTTSVARSEAADSGASKVPSKDPPAPAAPVLQREIRELAEYRDRLQGEFQEAYELLPRPVVMMTRLAAEFEEAEAEKKQGAPAGAKKGRAPSKSGVRLPGKRKQDPTAIEISEEDMLKIQEFIEYCKQNLDEIEHSSMQKGGKPGHKYTFLEKRTFDHLVSSASQGKLELEIGWKRAHLCSNRKRGILYCSCDNLQAMGGGKLNKRHRADSCTNVPKQ